MILGLSGIFGHDAAAAMTRSGFCLGMVEEERITRVKRAVNAVPKYAIQRCLREWGSGRKAPSRVAYGWSPTNRFHGEFRRRLIQAAPIVGQLEEHFVDHHVAHAAYAISVSELECGAFLVVDGHAETKSVSIGKFTGSEIRITEEFGIGGSPGHFYDAVADHLGFGPEGTGKVMGLAAYAEGDPDEFGFRTELMRHLDDRTSSPDTDYRQAGRTVLARWKAFLTRIAPPVRNARYEPHLRNGRDRLYVRIAASAQAALEEMLKWLARRAVSGSEDSLVYGGGVALNCKANYEIERCCGVRLYLAPASGDSGTSVGAALYASGSIKRSQHSPYLGARAEDVQIMSFLRECGIPFSVLQDPGADLAALICSGHVVARSAGRAEVGPRALGNRSILARPDKTVLRDAVNLLKRREPWRPLAPAMLPRHAQRLTRSPCRRYMLTAARQIDASARLEGVFHVDGTARVQCVSRKINPEFWDVLRHLDGAGVPGVLNTSFNDETEPIVYSHRDAVRTFFSTGLQYLLLGTNILVQK